MTPPQEPRLEDRLLKLVLRTYLWHFAAFIVLNVALTALNIWTGPPWWGLWPLVITGGLVTLHYLVYKTAQIDDQWVDDRAADIYGRSYDQGHIDSIANRHDLQTPPRQSEQPRQSAPPQAGSKEPRE